jgi:hypothetical protein
MKTRHVASHAARLRITLLNKDFGEVYLEAIIRCRVRSPLARCAGDAPVKRGMSKNENSLHLCARVKQVNKYHGERMNLTSLACAVSDTLQGEKRKWRCFVDRK